MNLAIDHEAVARMREREHELSTSHPEAAELIRHRRRERHARRWEQLARWAHQRANRVRDV